jgi:hypothetical protein
MMVVLLIAGIGFLLAGLLGIVFGIPVKEFSFGNTLIISGSVAACTGMITLGLWLVVRELKNIGRQLGEGAPAGSLNGAKRQAVLSAALGGPGLGNTGLENTGLENTGLGNTGLGSPEMGSAGLGNQPRDEGGFPFLGDRPATEHDGDAEASPSPMPWREASASRDRTRSGVPAAPEGAEAAPTAKPRRNLLFASSSRKERERAQSRIADPSSSDPQSRPVAAPPFESDETPPATFDETWTRPERPRAAEATASRRGGRAPSTFAEPSAGSADRQPPATPHEDPRPPVTVLKSGVVDGMAYSLYSDGSIEAQMPEGMMRFASIDELRAHLDQRP